MIFAGATRLMSLLKMSASSCKVSQRQFPAAQILVGLLPPMDKVAALDHAYVKKPTMKMIKRGFIKMKVPDFKNKVPVFGCVDFQKQFCPRLHQEDPADLQRL